MKIMINISLLNDNQGYAYFPTEVLKRIVSQNSGHDFIIIDDSLPAEKFSFGKNVIDIARVRLPQHPLLRKFWYDWKLPSIIKKHNADVFLSFDGFCSLRSSLPQCLLIHDLSFFNKPSTGKAAKNFLYRRYISRFLQKAAKVVTVSTSLKTDLAFRYKIPEKKIDVLYPAARDIFLPLTEAVKEEVRKKYSQEKNYFFYTGSLQSTKNLLMLLKAFSVFKKRQKSNWKLIIADGNKAGNSFIKSLLSYKYRDDVVLTDLLKDEELVNLTASAYAVIYVNDRDTNCIPVLEALNCLVPVIASADLWIKELTGDAVLHSAANDSIDLADKMMLLYKDESLRNSLLEKGKQITAMYSVDTLAASLWQTIQKAYASSGSTLK